MTAADAAEFVAGAIIVVLALRDVFHTVVVAGVSAGGLKIARRLVFLMRPLWLKARRQQGFPPTFGPLILVLSFTTWMGLLALGFGLMAHALSGSFDPPLTSFSQAVYLVGSGLVTVGLSETDALGPARWVILGSGFCGLAVMTMTVTYLLEVQTSIAERDSTVLKLQTSAGSPPSAHGLLVKFAEIGAVSDLADVLKDGRDWCASVRQSHLTYPALIYFHGKGTGSGWPASLGALLEIAVITEHCLDLPELHGRAVLVREEAVGLAAELADLLALQARNLRAEAGVGARIRARLAAAGYPVQRESACAELDRSYMSCLANVVALAGHLGEEPKLIIPAV